MKITKISAASWLILFLILASCSTALVDYENDVVKDNKSISGSGVIEFFSYQEFNSPNIKAAETLLKTSSLKGKQRKDLRLLHRNLQQVKAKEAYVLKLHPKDPYASKIIQLIYHFNLPITALWDQANKKHIFSDLVSDKPEGFCASLYDDALQSIYNEINQSSESTLIIYAPEYQLLVSEIRKSLAQVDSILLASNDLQEFTARILGIEDSNKRLSRIQSLNPNKKLIFVPRSRSDVERIILLLQPKDYKSVIPALRYHGGNKFKYINFISAVQSLDSTKKLLDYEGSFIPLSFYLSKKFHSGEQQSINGILENAILNDWLLNQILDQAGIRSAEIYGMTGKLIYEKNRCMKRIIPLQKIDSRWVNS